MQATASSISDPMDAANLSDPRTFHTVVWVHRMTLLVAFFSLLLIVFGGHVTTIAAGDTEPAWSLRFWAWFIPWHQLEGGHFYEMTHRQLGTIVGFLALAMVALLWRMEERAWVRRLGYIAFALIVVQGILGGMRVLVVSDPSVQETAMQATGLADGFGVRVLFGMVHATLGLALFALLIGITEITSPCWFAPRLRASSRAVAILRGITVWTAAALILQVVLGAWLRHAGWHAGVILLHAVGGLAVALFALIIAVVAYGLDPKAALVRRPAFVLAALVQVQIFLGIFSFVLPETVLIPTLHHVVGAVLLALCVLTALRVRQLLEPVSPV